MVGSPAATQPAQVVVIASWNTDLTCRIPRPLRKGETLLGHDFEQGPGGKGSNATIACARQGVATAIVARIGDDDFGRQGLALWSAEGIATEAVVIAPGERSGVAQILVYDDGDNSIAVMPGAGAGLSAAHMDERAALIGQARVLVLSNEVPLPARQRALALAKAAASPPLTLLNPAPAQNLPEELLVLCDVLTPNEDELLALAGLPDSVGVDAAALHLMQRLPQLKALVVTLGASGCGLWLRDGRELKVHRLPGWPMDPVVDTVGAGDTFTGALAAALARGLPWLVAARQANAAAALSVTGRGAIAGMPSRAQTEALLARAG